MPVFEDFIFANHAMHERFCAVAEVLSLFVAESSRVMSLAQLKRNTKRCAIELRQICADLSGLRLLLKQSGRGERWLLVKDVTEITLEDVYNCILNAQGGDDDVAKQPSKKRCQSGLFSGTLDVFIMQAAMEISQNNRRHLRLFYLNRLPLDPLR